MSASKVQCRVCEKVDRKSTFDDVFHCRFTPDKASDEVYFYEAMQQLTGIEIIEISDEKNKICPNCRIRIQYAYQLRSDIIESNDRLLSSTNIKLTKMDSDTSMAVYKIVELDEDLTKGNSKFEFVSIENEQSIDVEYLVDSSRGDGEQNSSPVPIHLSSHIYEDSSIVDSFEVPNGFKPTQNEDEEQDAVSFLLGNCHLLEKMEDFDNQKKKKLDDPNGINRPHKCKVCSKSFLRKSNLMDHLRLHANLRLYRCEHCDKSFVQAGNFKSHLRIHTKERPYACSLCPKTYNQSSALKVHIRSHTNERNYVCNVCSKSFTNSSDLGKHKRVHDPNQKLSCPHCDKKFAQKINLKNHVRKHHPNEEVHEKSIISIKLA